MEVSSKAFLRKVKAADAGSVITIKDDNVLSLVTEGAEFSAPAIYAKEDREIYHEFLSVISGQSWGVADNEKDLVRMEECDG